MGGMFAKLGAVEIHGKEEDGSSNEGEMDQEKEKFATESRKLAEQKAGNEVIAKDVVKELKSKERELEEKERKFQHLKRRFEEERRVNERKKRRQYRMEREVGELEQKVGMWEREERMRKRERIREKKKRLYERGDEREKVRQEMLTRRQNVKK